MLKVTKGQIWEVDTDDFYGNKNIKEIPRRTCVKLEKGERIEIRYPSPWHYRTEDNMYLYSEQDYILSKCKLIGKVNEKIRFENKASLEEILRLGLWE